MFQGLKKILKYFQTIQKTFTMLVFFDHDVGDQHRGGYKSVAPKMVFLRFCARSALLARTKFLGQPLITYKTFPSDRFSRIVVLTSKNTIGENGEYPPPHTHMHTLRNSNCLSWHKRMIYDTKYSLITLKSNTLAK